ncbi:MAG: hypothetical protein Q8L77_16905 [Nitrospirota bacterium]|nr:hypothetical protein [Nitrospirota bacterium]
MTQTVQKFPPAIDVPKDDRVREVNYNGVERLDPALRYPCSLLGQS